MALDSRGPDAARGPRLERFAEDRDAWARQETETTKAYAAFVVFRDLGALTRTLGLTARNLGKSKTVVVRWSMRYRWTERAERWDDAQRVATDRVRREEQDKAIRRHAQASSALMNQALRILAAQPLESAPDGRAIQQAAMALDKAIHHNRLALGLPTDVTRQDVHLKQMLDEALQTQDTVRAVIEEHICDDCRERVGAQLRRLAEHQRRLTERASAP